MAKKPTTDASTELLQGADASADQAQAAAAEQPPAAETASEQTEDAGTVKARVLVDGRFGRVNQVVEVPADTQSSEIDTNPEAVAYAESLKD